ncbi:MAG: GntR family transcriptional regulator [Bacillota bacterium]
MPDYKLPSERALNHHITEPLYHQLLLILKREIETGRLHPGDQIPPESQLCAKYGLSRTTVRQALQILADDNTIIRRRGKGSFVANPKLHRNLNHLYSFTEDMLALGLTPGSEILEKSFCQAPGPIAEALRLPPGDQKTFRLVRVRLANREPLLLETTFIPHYLCPGIDAKDLSSSSLYQILQDYYHLNLHHAAETIEAFSLDKESAARLGCKKGACGFKIQRLAFLNSGMPFELTSSVARGDKCLFKVELQTGKHKVNFSREINL